MFIKPSQKLVLGSVEFNYQVLVKLFDYLMVCLWNRGLWFCVGLLIHQLPVSLSLKEPVVSYLLLQSFCFDEGPVEIF